MTLPVEVRGYDTDGLIYCCYNGVLHKVSIHDISETWLVLIVGAGVYTGIPLQIILAANAAGQLDKPQPCPSLPSG